jgi:energy-coupling factor transport system ATP-binding protein
MIRIRNLSFRYQGADRNALSDISLHIPEGDFLGIIGSSGAGKSTLTYAMNGVAPHHFPGDFYGEVLIDGLDTVNAGVEQISRRVGSVFQDIDGQMVASVAEDEILFGLENFGVDHREIEDRLEGALAAAGISELRNRTISSLSGGQKQKLAIAAITALRPKIIVLDEPTGELDPRSSRRIFEYLRELNEDLGLTIVAVEQKIMLLCEFAKHLMVMDRGAVVRQGTVDEVLQRPDILKNAGVNIPRVTSLGERLREQGIYTGKLPRDLDQARTMMESCNRRPAPGTPAEGPARNGSGGAAGTTGAAGSTGSGRSGEMLRFERVSFSYAPGGEGTIRDLSFVIGAGEFVALLGENGAGKSTLCRLCNGLLKPSGGRVFLAAQDTRLVKTSLLARRAGYLFQNPDRQLCQNTVREEILFGLDYVLAGMAPEELEAEKQRRLEEMLELFGLDGNRDPFGLSRGERQQTALASVLARRPEILILDEPTTGLDYRECVTIMDLISRLHAGGTTVLMISHDMEVVADYARRILVLNRGALIGDGPVREIMGNAELLGRASLLPAQIPALGMILGGIYRPAFSVEEMAALAAGNGTAAEESR